MGAINEKINQIAIEHYEDNNVRFAEEYSTTESTIRNYRKDAIPKLDFIIKIHQKLEINYEWLLGNESVHAVAEPTEGYGKEKKSKKNKTIEIPIDIMAKLKQMEDDIVELKNRVK